MDQFPFLNSKIPICNNLNELKEILNKYPEFKACVYLAYKDNFGWDKSTSRIYFNKVLPNFLYIPLNITQNNYEELSRFYAFAEIEDRIIAINQTQPHKDNPIIKEFFRQQPNLPTNIDTIIKDAQNQFVPLSLNGEAFVNWYTNEVGGFNNKKVIIFGVGGAGEPISRKIATLNPSQLTLIDIIDKQDLSSELTKYCNSKYLTRLKELNYKYQTNLILINCTGKEGTSDNTGLIEFLRDNPNNENVFVDIRPHLDIAIVEQANQLGWQSYTGYGMNARNDYVLLQKIGEKLDTTIMNFQQFAELVKNAS